ncbi:hypothetical protein MMC08_007180, partial [Hypocenomyce scalaris]|nr:hypothetical protein [Hypocenomyce scalaris]
LRIDYYGEDHQDEVHELPAELGMQRANSRAINRSRNSSGNRRHRSRHDSTGQGSVSNVSELSSDGDTGAATRPTVSHQRQASDQSDTSRVSDLSSRVDGVGVPSPAGEQSPMTPGSGVMTPVDRPELE